jgi:hypothetical protein
VREIAGGQHLAAVTDPVAVTKMLLDLEGALIGAA